MQLFDMLYLTKLSHCKYNPNEHTYVNYPELDDICVFKCSQIFNFDTFRKVFNLRATIIA